MKQTINIPLLFLIALLTNTGHLPGRKHPDSYHKCGSCLFYSHMSKDYAKSFYNSKAWKSCRTDYINKRIMIDGGTCERCHIRPGYIVHHKAHISPNNIHDQDITLNHCNLEYVCKVCHDEEHRKEMFEGRRAHAGTQMQQGCLFGPDGQLIPNDAERIDRLVIAPHSGR